jgi:hypothetical protein
VSVKGFDFLHKPLSLQIHPVSERRLVSGRSKSFDSLLEEHRKKRKMKKLNRLRVEGGMEGGMEVSTSPSR